MFKGKNSVLIVGVSIIAGAALGLIAGLILNQQVWGSIIGSAVGVIVGAIIYNQVKKK